MAPTVLYSKPMPSIDSLMQAFEPEIEAKIARLAPHLGSDSPLSVEQLTRVACALLDIPVQEDAGNKNLIESLHVLFSLYSAFSANDHFQTSHAGSVSAHPFVPSNVQRIEFN